eukprot:scaffold23601_cov78-Skeletonema_dohrnii-CCMP3373.AAC.1
MTISPPTQNNYSTSIGCRVSGDQSRVSAALSRDGSGTSGGGGGGNSWAGNVSTNSYLEKPLKRINVVSPRRTKRAVRSPPRPSQPALPSSPAEQDWFA